MWFKVLCVIEGDADTYIYPRSGTKRWDTCAPEALLRALGGGMTDCFGRVYSYEKRDDLTVENNYGLIASVNRPPEFYSQFISDELKKQINEDAQ